MKAKLILIPLLILISAPALAQKPAKPAKGKTAAAKEESRADKFLREVEESDEPWSLRYPAQNTVAQAAKKDETPVRPKVNINDEPAKPARRVETYPPPEDPVPPPVPSKQAREPAQPAPKAEPPASPEPAVPQCSLERQSSIFQDWARAELQGMKRFQEVLAAYGKDMEKFSTCQLRFGTRCGLKRPAQPRDYVPFWDGVLDKARSSDPRVYAMVQAGMWSMCTEMHYLLAEEACAKGEVKTQAQVEADIRQYCQMPPKLAEPKAR